MRERERERENTTRQGPSAKGTCGINKNYVVHLNERLLKTFIVVKSDSAIEHTTTLGKQLILKTSGLPKPKTELENCYHLFFKTTAFNSPG